MQPTPRSLARAIADQMVILGDECAHHAGPSFWRQARPWLDELTSAVGRLDDERVRAAAELVLHDPRGNAYCSLRHLLETELSDSSRGRAKLDLVAEIAWLNEGRCRIGYVHGPSRLPDDRPFSLDDMLVENPRRASGLRVGQALVVIPFRDASANRGRLRNLLACLRALNDQSVDRGRYQLTVVECDEKPRWGTAIEPLVDTYIFAAKAGQFNRAWGVNVGAVNSPGGAEVLCIMDADVLADREFIERNCRRFTQAGTSAHLPYRDMLCLDEAATARSVNARLVDRRPSPDTDLLRGFTLRRPPGCCMWVRMDAFQRLSGMDERYEGWGGEDNDFAYRLDVEAPLDIHDDTLLHMHHSPSASSLRPRAETGAQDTPIPLTWATPYEDVGRLDRFGQAGDA